MSERADGRGIGARRRILIVGMHTSVHVARWVDMVHRDDAAIIVFPVYTENFKLPPELRYISLSNVSKQLAPGLWVVQPADIHRGRDTFIDICNRYRRWSHSFLSGNV